MEFWTRLSKSGNHFLACRTNVPPKQTAAKRLVTGKMGLAPRTANLILSGHRMRRIEKQQEMGQGKSLHFCNERVH